MSAECAWAVPILRLVPRVADNPYFLVRVTLAQVLCQMPYANVQLATGDLSFQESSLACLERLLADRDQRVRSAASEAIVK